VYALGVMLYELLAGERPYETAGRTVDEVIAMVIDREPSRPSATHRADLPYDARRLSGDLDAIVLKAIAKQPGSRYGSAEELGEDVVRVLTGAVVVARKPSLAYVARKTVARHRAAFGVAAVFCVLLVAALVGAIWQAHVAARERERAVQRFNDVRQLAGALIFRIHDEVATLAGSTPVRQTVIAEGLKFLERLEAGVEEDSGLRLELAQAYLRIGNVQGRIGGANLGNRESAIQSYRKARLLIAPLAIAGRSSWEVVQTLVDANLALAYGTDRDEAVTSSKTALATATEWAAREPETVRAKELLARANQQIAVTARFEPGSLPNLLEAERLFDDVLADDEGNPARLRNAALIKKYLGRHFDEAGDAGKSLEYFRRALILDEKRLRGAPEDRQVQNDVAIDLGGIGEAYWRRGETAEAIDAYRQSLEIRARIAAADPKNAFAQGRVAYIHHMLAKLFVSSGALRAAEDHVNTAIATNEALIRSDRIYRAELAGSLQTLAEIEWRKGRPLAACGAYGRAQRLFALVEDRDLGSDQRTSKVEVERALARCEGR
jgi:non-specific serine/threonine protein kinase/serine/threonine-protein kinase